MILRREWNGFCLYRHSYVSFIHLLCAHSCVHVCMCVCTNKLNKNKKIGKQLFKGIIILDLMMLKKKFIFYYKKSSWSSIYTSDAQLFWYWGPNNNAATLCRLHEVSISTVNDLLLSIKLTISLPAFILIK